MNLNAKQAITDIKKLLFGSEAPPAADPAAPPAPDAQSADIAAVKEYSLVDGSKVFIDKLEAGGIVSIADATGVMTPVAAGSIALADGTAIVVGEGGAIQSITEPVDAPAPDGMGAAPTHAFMEQVAAKFASGTPDDRLANLEVMCKALMASSFGWKISEAELKGVETAAINAYKNLTVVPAAMAAQFDAMKAEAAAHNTRTEQAFTALLDFVGKLAETPAAEPSTKNKEAFAATEDDTRLAKAEAFLALKNKNK